MKKLLCIYTILIYGVFISKAQPNGGFENWSTNYSLLEPDNWQTLNFISLTAPNPLSAFKATGIDKHSGNYALKLKTVYFSNNPLPEQVGDTTGGVFTGKVTLSPFTYKYGFPYSGRPEKLEFWSKYYPVGNDTAGAIVILKKWNGIYSDTIAIGGTNINSTAGYSLFQTDLIYYSTELPDSAFIGFSASKIPQIARINSTLYIDDVTFLGWVGMDKYEQTERQVKISPNPAKDNLTIFTEIEMAKNVKVMDSLGKLVGVYKIENYFTTININTFADGMYFYEICDKKENIITNGKFNVIK
jgi:hypothetical protein